MGNFFEFNYAVETNVVGRSYPAVMTSQTNSLIAAQESSVHQVA